MAKTFQIIVINFYLNIVYQNVDCDEALKVMQTRILFRDLVYPSHYKMLHHFCHFVTINMGVRTGVGARGAPAKPGRKLKNNMFLDFYGEKSIFLVVFRQKVGSCPPPGKCLPSPGNKSADAHDYKSIFLNSLVALHFWVASTHFLIANPRFR